MASPHACGRYLFVLLILYATVNGKCVLFDTDDNCPMGSRNIVQPETANAPGSVCVPCDTTNHQINQQATVDCQSLIGDGVLFPLHASSLDLRTLRVSDILSAGCRVEYELATDDLAHNCPLYMTDGDRFTLHFNASAYDICQAQSCILRHRLDPMCPVKCMETAQPYVVVQIPRAPLDHVEVVSNYPTTVPSCIRWLHLEYDLASHSRFQSLVDHQQQHQDEIVHAHIIDASKVPWFAHTNFTATRNALVWHNQTCNGEEHLTAHYHIAPRQCPHNYPLSRQQSITWSLDIRGAPHFNLSANPLRLLEFQCPKDFLRFLNTNVSVLNACNEVIGQALPRDDRRRSRLQRHSELADLCLSNVHGQVTYEWNNPHCAREHITKTVEYHIATQPTYTIEPSPRTLGQALQLSCHQQFDTVNQQLRIQSPCQSDILLTPVSTVTSQTSVDRFNVTLTWDIPAICSQPPARVSQNIQVYANQPPRLENPDLITGTREFMCLSHVPTLKPDEWTVISQCNAAVQRNYQTFQDQPGDNGPDDLIIYRDLVLTDANGQETHYNGRAVVKDTTVPDIFHNTTLLYNACLWPRTGDYVAISNFTKTIVNFWKPPLCGGKNRIEVLSVRPLDCVSDNEAHCLQDVPTRNNGQPAVHYHLASDTLYMRAEGLRDRRGRLYKVKVAAISPSQVNNTREFNFLVPGIGPGEERPAGQAGHPCDRHQWLQVPTLQNSLLKSPYGTCQSLTQIPSTALTATSQRRETSSTKIGRTSDASSLGVAMWAVGMTILFTAFVVVVESYERPDRR